MAEVAGAGDGERMGEVRDGCGVVQFGEHKGGVIREVVFGGEKGGGPGEGARAVEAENAAAVPRITSEIDAMFANSPYPTRTESQRAFALSFLSFLGNVKLYLLTICGAVTFTILLVTANTMAMSVRERRREVGILTTLGYPNGAILGMILGESAIIAAAGGVVGLILASGAAAVVRAGPPFVQQLKTLYITGPVALFCVAFAMLIGVMSSVVPASGAARTTILEALRSTE